MKLLQKRSYKHLDLFQSLIIAYLMGGVNQARKSAKKLKSQTNEPEFYSSLKSISSGSDGYVVKGMESAIRQLNDMGVL